MRRSSKNESTHQENKHSFHIKWRVVLLQTTCRFEKVTCCFSSNDVSFYLLWNILVEDEKKGHEVQAVTLVIAKKVKPCRMRARIYARERHLLNFCFWHCFVRAERRFSTCILQGQQNYQILSFWCCFVNCIFQNWCCLQRKLHFFVIFSLFGAISPHILIGRCFETW